MCVLGLGAWHRRRRDRPVAGYQQLCRELAAAGPGTFGELDSVGARSVLRRCSGAWFGAAGRRRAGESLVRFPRRRRRLLPVRWYRGTFTLDGRRLRLPTAAGCAPLWLRLDREIPYPPGQVRSVTLLHQGARLFVEVAAEVAVAVYPHGDEPDPARVAGVDLGIIYPYAVAGPGGQALLVSGRAIRAEHRTHLCDTRARRRAVARRAPAPGQRGSPVAQDPPPHPAGRGPAPPPHPPDRARGRQHRHRPGGGPPGRHPDRRRPPRCPCTRMPAGGTTCGCAGGRSAAPSPSSRTRPPRPASPCTRSTNAAPPRPAPAAGGASPNHRAGPCPAHTAAIRATATLPRRPPSPPAPPVAHPPPRYPRAWSRTIEPDDTYPVPDHPGVTPAAPNRGVRISWPAAARPTRT